MKKYRKNRNQRLKKIGEFFGGNRIWFFLFTVLSLLIPDLVLKTRVIFVDFRVDEGGFLRAWLCNIVAVVFTVLWIALILYICIWLLPKKAGRIVFTVIASLANIFMISEYIYYTMFGRFFMLSSIFLANEGMAYVSILYQYISPWLILFTVLSVGSLVLSCKLWKNRKRPKRWWLWGIIPLVLIFVLNSYMTISSAEKENTKIWSTWKRPRYVYSDMADPDRCIRIMGVYQFLVRSATYPIFSDIGFKEEDFQKVDAYVKTNEEEALKKPEANEMTGIFKDKNVIAIMLESMDDWMISRETTPTIYRLMNEGINFEKHIASPFGGGYTFNSEFAFNTGYYTPKSSSSASIYGYNQFPYTMPRLFKEQGYTPRQFHYNKMEFYNRATMHKAFGYEGYVSFMDYMTESEAELDSNAMLLPNEEIYKEMTSSEKFFDYVITYSAHLPYNADDKIDEAKKKYPELVDKVTPDEFKRMMLKADAMCDEIDFSEITEEKWWGYTNEYNNARLLAKDTDEFVRLLIEKLERDGLMENTVLVVFADHYTYGYSNKKIVKGLSVLDGERLIEETPFFIYSKGMKPMKVTKVSSTMDILPTMSNLFGLKWFGGYIGSDVFDPENTGFAYFSDMSWYDGNIYRDDTYEPKDDAEREYIEKMDKKMMDCVNINDIIIAGDYFARNK